MSVVVESANTSVSVAHYGYAERVRQPSAVMYYAMLAVLTVGLFLVMAGFCQADDLLKAGDKAVNDTVGKNSSVMKWLLMLEVLSAIFGFIATRNLKVLGGIIALSIFINICYAIIG